MKPAIRNAVFFGTGELVAGVAGTLLSKGLNVVVVTTRTQAKGVEHPSGATIILAESLADVDLAHLPRDAAAWFAVGAPWFFREDFLVAAGRPILNVHGTQLPRNRGGSVFSWQILAGLRTGMCLLHEIRAGLDAGPIVAAEEFIYPGSCRTPRDYMREYNRRNASLVERFCQSYDPAAPPHVAGVQPEYLSTYWPRLRADVNGWIDWSMDALELERFICAFDDPYGGARTRHRGRLAILRDVYAQSADGYTHPFQHGLVYRKTSKWLHVAARNGELLVCSVTGPDGADLIDSINVGDRFSTPPDDLHRAGRRIIKNSSGLDIQPQLPE